MKFEEKPKWNAKTYKNQLQEGANLLAFSF